MTTFIAAWPVLDEDRPMGDLVDEANDELAVLAWQTGCVVTATPRWRIDDREPSSLLPSSPTGLYLVCEAPARSTDETRRRLR